MYGDEFAKIRHAADEYAKAASLIEEIDRRRKQLKRHCDQKELLKIAVIGNTGTIEIPEVMQSDLGKWLDERFAKVQSDARKYQQQLTCPAGTNDR